MGELKINYSDKKVTPFAGMKLLKDFIDTSNIIKYQIGALQQWVNINNGIDVCNLYFKPDNAEMRRYVIVRKKIEKLPQQWWKASL